MALIIDVSKERLVVGLALFGHHLGVSTLARGSGSLAPARSFGVGQLVCMTAPLGRLTTLCVNFYFAKIIYNKGNTPSSRFRPCGFDPARLCFRPTCRHGYALHR